MMSLTVVFWMYVILFAIIGAMRGWAKELLVTFSVILALFTITVLETYVGVIRNLANGAPTTIFWVESTILLLMVFFGFQSPNLRAIAGARFARERVQDSLLGFILGAFNGYLAVGSFWYFMHKANYPLNIIQRPVPGTDLGNAALELITLLPPDWLVIPWIYFAVALAFVFVIVVFL
jgi:hypothetical protein